MGCLYVSRSNVNCGWWTTLTARLDENGPIGPLDFFFFPKIFVLFVFGLQRRHENVLIMQQNTQKKNLEKWC